jgi:hypothetical protein
MRKENNTVNIGQKKVTCLCDCGLQSFVTGSSFYQIVVHIFPDGVLKMHMAQANNDDAENGRT